LKVNLHIVIVTYKSKHTIEECLNNLSEHLKQEDTVITIIDNYGKDCIDQVVKKYKKVKYLFSGGNIGFGAGCNLGFLQEDSTYTLFLNPDAVIDNENILKLVDFLNTNPNTAVVGPCIKSGDTLQHSGSMPLPPLWLKRKTEYFKGSYRAILPGSVPQKTNWICGAIYLVRSSIYEEVGGFDENFFLYFEETDLCFRILQQGSDIYAVGESIASHIGGASSSEDNSKYIHGCIAEHYFEGRYYFLRKSYGLSSAVVYELHKLFRLFLSSLKAVFYGKQNLALIELKTRLRYPLFRSPQQSKASNNYKQTNKTITKATNKTAIALTFDDAPSINEHGVNFDPNRMHKVLGILKKHNIPHCTAFVIGEFIPGNEEILKEWLSAGYELGNHMHHHQHSSGLNEDEFIKSVSKCDHLLNELGAFNDHQNKWFRFPYLDYGLHDLQRRKFNMAIKKLGYRVAHASLCFNDDLYEKLLATNPENSKLISRYIESSILTIQRCLKFAKNGEVNIRHIVYSHFGDVNVHSLNFIICKLNELDISWTSLENAIEHSFYRNYELMQINNGLAFDPKILSSNTKKSLEHFYKLMPKLDYKSEKKYGPYRKTFR